MGTVPISATRTIPEIRIEGSRFPQSVSAGRLHKIGSATIDPVSLAPANPVPEALAGRSGCGRALAGFLLSGFLMALLGAILPAWGYHRDPPDFVAVGNDFLSLAVGVVAP